MTTCKTAEKFKKLLDPATYLPGDNPRQSEMVLITRQHSLGLLRNGILDGESYALKTIAGN
jgi:hypothetical protein